jgi:eukaryotic-like serine/threonine-protein kinase
VADLTPQRWKNVEEVFEAVLQLPPPERPAYLEQACGNDLKLRNQVETLLLSLDRAGSHKEIPTFGVALSETEVEERMPTMIGKRLGSYRIEREIGRGGMGSVYLAVRADDAFDKRVAIKLIKRGMDTDFIVRRFRNERQILASLDHPNIARLLDGGTTDDSLPYFVMEYVEGQPIYQYCDDHRLSIADRLKLFRKVCAAVHYAHENLVIHRDLKPNNIIVTTAGAPKLLDFGIAKLLNPDMSSQALDPTTAAVRLMTPEYASPEQVRGETVSAASDVYCLGVLLYELLTDHRPYRINSRQPHELTYVICETEPDLPSVVVNLIEVFLVEGRDPIETTPETVSEARSTTPDQLRRELSGSLDNIILKAMRKEPQKRYSSVEEFSDHIDRYLGGHRVSAPSYFPSPAKSEVDTCEPATGSRSLAVLPFQVLRVEEKSDEFLGMGLTDAIITKLSNLHQIMVRPTSAVAKYFDGTHNILAAGHELDVGYVLDGRIQRAGDRLRLTVQLVRMSDGNPLWAAKFDENYTDIFTVEDSISEQVANALVPRLSGEEREMLLKRETEDSNAYQAFLKGRYFWNRFTPEDFAKALEQFREAIRLDPNFAQAHVGIADYHNWAAIFGLGTPTENFFEAKAAAIKALELDESLAEAHAALAFTNLCYDWDWEGAEHRFKRSLELNPNYAPAHQWYSNLLAAQGRFDEAIAAIKRAQELNPLSLMDRSIGGWTYYHARCYQLAEQELEATLEIDRNFSNGHLTLGFVYERMGRYDESIQALELCLELMPGSPVPLCPLGYALASSGRKEMALEIVERLKKQSQEVYVSPYFIALIYTGLGNHEAAFEWLEKACESRDEWMLWLGVEPKFDPIRSDPRFAGLLQRVGLTGDETARAISYSSDRGVNLLAPLLPGHSGKRKSGSSTGEIEPASPTLADAVFAVHRDHKRERRVVLAGAAVLCLLVAGFLGYRFMQMPAANFASTTLEKLTATGNVIDAAISGDGKYVAFIMDEGGKQGLWLRQRAIANNIRLVAPAAVEYKGLVFSPDGNYVYYVSREKNARHGSLYQVPALGGSVRALKNDVDSPIGISPDAKQIAFVRSETEKGEDVLIVADEKGGTEHALATRKFPERFSQLTAPLWSLDGKMILNVTESSDSNGFYLRISGMPIGGGDEVSLSARRWLEINRIAWMPDGSGLILSAHDSTTAFHHLWLINSSGGPDQRITSDLNDYLTVSISSSPMLLLSVQRQMLTNIWVAPPDQPAQSLQVSSGAGRFFDLRWTSDGKMLYASDASGNADIWEMDADGTNQRQLTAGASRNYAPVASPDRRYVVFHSNRSGRWQIWRMNRDGGNQTQLTKDEEDSNWPEFSPDGRWIFYQHMDSGTPTLWKMSVDGETPKRLTSTFSMRPAVSPDGNSIAYWQKEPRPDAPWRIAISSLDAQPSVVFFEVVQTAANGYSALRWSADGRSILYITAGNDVTKLTSQSLEGGPAKDLASFSKEQFYSFDQSGDGRYVYSRGLRTSDAVIITNSR